MKKPALVVLMTVMLLTLASCKKSNQEIAPPSDYLMIVQGKSYAAFTDLQELNGRYYCVFRQAKNHIGETPGKIVVKQSVDGITWSICHEIAMENKDLRDPCFIDNKNGELQISFFSALYRKPNNIISNFISKISIDTDHKVVDVKTEEIILDQNAKGYVLWHITRYNDQCYAVAYNNRNSAVLLKSSDDKKFTKVCTLENIFDPQNYLNECSLVFDTDGSLFMASRTLTDKWAIFGEAKYPYTEWKFQQKNMRLGGPKMKLLGDKIVLGTRGVKANTVVYTVNKNNETIDLTKVLDSPQYGDTGYPGLIKVGKELWVSYYVGNPETGESNIFLMKKQLWD